MDEDMLGTTKNFLKPIPIILLFLIISSIIGGILYALGSQSPHSPIRHPLNQIFKQQEQQELIEKLNERRQQYTMVKGQQNSGVLQFLQHYADKRSKKGKTVYFYEAVAFSGLRRLGNYLFTLMSDESEEMQSSQYIFLVNDEQIPIQEIEQIKQMNQGNRILIGVTDQQQGPIQGFSSVEYPAITIEDLGNIIESKLQLSPLQVKILVRFYRTIPKLFLNLKSSPFSRDQLLGKYYYDIEQLDSDEKKLLKKLCKQGTTKTDIWTQYRLKGAGVLIYQQTAYWVHKQNILNYELDSQQECIHETVPIQIYKAKYPPKKSSSSYRSKSKSRSKRR